MTIRKHVGRRLTDDQESVLVGGPGILSFTTLGETFGTMEDAHAAWVTHGERLTAEHGRPGVPLWGWEQFEATAEELERGRAVQEQRQRELRAQSKTVDPIGRVIPLTRSVVFPEHDGANGRHDP